MNFFKISFASLTFLLLFSCKPSESVFSINELLKNNYRNGNSIALFDGINDTTFVKLKKFSNAFIFDMKYATNDNFLKKKVYDCDECYLRLKTAKNLIEANTEFLTKGYRIKLFDCYRPIDVQKKMWELVPNADYVADPKKGSIHNRGGAVDITLVDKDGNELDMGTKFDFFGPEASHNFQNFSEKIKQNRSLLKEIMLKHNFKSFDSEWWHYNLTDSYKDNLANFKWDCN
ncbi:M15 family metallopeptidase [Flavobacterium sp. SUN052]|uniref:M15 family metallopeptidase n=1 Tax=Flavobacterium sp. SUN052 TaxID=3002441 RepID=UPI00237E072E|nr:M15 family metallopeptidase [Flavobacterium sp. SUN052]MEC4005146.1 M15 family metallopeptidase [Flavobacterium sp. SUN052]